MRQTTRNSTNWTCRICDANALDLQECESALVAPVAERLRAGHLQPVGITLEIGRWLRLNWKSYPPARHR